MRFWTHYGDPEPDDLEALGMVELTPNIEAGTKAYIERWVELAPRTDTKACFEAGLAAAFTPPGNIK